MKNATKRNTAPPETVLQDIADALEREDLVMDVKGTLLFPKQFSELAEQVRRLRARKN